MKAWKTDDDLFSLAKSSLYTAVVGDVLDKLGYQQQFLPPYLQPLREDMITIGRAMPVLEADVFAIGNHNPLLQKPFGLMLEALDDLKPNEIYICTGSSPSYALWGELMATRARHLGAVGAVLDGYSRDTKDILAMGFPVFSKGRYAQDQGPRGKVIDYRVPIQMGQASINPGDIIFGDMDGVLVIPKEVEEEAFTQAIEKVNGENTVRDAIRAGMSSAEAFKKYGVM